MLEAQRINFEALRRELSDRLGISDERLSANFDKFSASVEKSMGAGLSERFDKSFSVVAAMLSDLNRGLGEMKRLSTGVEGLERILGSTKTRGTWGEVQLRRILDDILAPGQFTTDYSPPGSAEKVEFAVKVPSDTNSGGYAWLPLDSKFPREPYERLINANACGDVKSASLARKDLRTAVLQMCRDVSQKYIRPPETTDFAVIFLPTEGLYAEVTEMRGLGDEFQSRRKIMFAGPSVLAAMLNSISLGLRSIAIRRHADETIKTLSGVKNEIDRYAEDLAKLSKNLNYASQAAHDALKHSNSVSAMLEQIGSGSLENK